MLKLHKKLIDGVDAVDNDKASSFDSKHEIFTPR